MPGPYGGPADQRIIQPHDHKSVHLVFFLPNGAPSWCKCCAHLVLFFFKIVHLAGVQNLCSSGTFFLQNGALAGSRGKMT